MDGVTIQEAATCSDVDADAVRLVTEIGFLAAGSGAFTEAQAIFDGLKAVRPEGEAGDLGLAFTLISSGRPQEAAALLRSGLLRRCPNSEYGRTFLGLALHLAGRDAEGRTVLADLVASAREGSARRLAEGLLNTRGGGP